MAKVKNILGAVTVLFLLVGLPAISYWYLKTGYDYRKEAILTQGDFGKMPDLSGLPALRGELPTSLRGSMTVVGWLDPSKPATAQQYGTMLDSLYVQFSDSPNLHFTTITKASDGHGAVAEFTDRHNLPADPMVSFLAADETTFAKTARDLSVPAGVHPGESPLVALVDSSLTIVKHYDLSKREETIGLVQLISLIIPLPERKDIIVNRTQEL
ncbi:MAG: hypothetical protein AAFZ52_11900 [Bacteroidota bacterium]